MGKISMIGSTLAKEDQVFTYVGPAEECTQCTFSKVCQNLEMGKRYRVAALRRITHDCLVHEGKKVTVVEVEEIPLEISIPERKALEGALVTLDEEECPLKWCKDHWLCRRSIYGDQVKVSIISVNERLKCPRDLKLKRAVVNLK